MIKKIVAALLALVAAAAFAAVDVNKATQAELDSIKGIGPVIAGKILDERKKSAFKDWPDLIERVKGVGERNAAKFSTGGLTVNGTAFAGAPAAPAAPAAAKKETKPAAAPAAPAAMPAAVPATPAAATKATAADDKKAAKAAKADADKQAKDEKAAAAKKAKDDKAAVKKATADEKAAKAGKPAAAAASAPVKK